MPQVGAAHKLKQNWKQIQKIQVCQDFYQTHREHAKKTKIHLTISQI